MLGSGGCGEGYSDVTCNISTRCHFILHTGPLSCRTVISHSSYLDLLVKVHRSYVHETWVEMISTSFSPRIVYITDEFDKNPISQHSSANNSSGLFAHSRVQNVPFPRLMSRYRKIIKMSNEMNRWSFKSSIVVESVTIKPVPLRCQQVMPPNLLACIESVSQWPFIQCWLAVEKLDLHCPSLPEIRGSLENIIGWKGRFLLDIFSAFQKFSLVSRHHGNE